MYFLAQKNLLQEKTRFAISIGGVAFSVLLMILLQGLNVGFSNVLGQYFETVKTDLWVASANTGNIMDPSFLQPDLGNKLEAIPGVAEAKPFGMQNATTYINGKGLAFYLVAYDPGNNTGAPGSVSEGKATPSQGEIVMDRITAKTNNIKLDDTVPFPGRGLKVVGFSEGTFLLSTSFAFINKSDAKTIYSLPTTTNYWLVSVKPGADVATVQSAINSRFPNVNAHTKSHFIQINVDLMKSIVQPIFSALVVLGALIGTTIIGLTIFTSTIEKAKEYGVLKALGLKNRQLYIIVMQQALIATTLGYLIGALLAFALKSFITEAVPQFLTDIRFIDLGWILAVTIVMAIVASYLPIRRLNQIDPAEVFRS